MTRILLAAALAALLAAAPAAAQQARSHRGIVLAQLDTVAALKRGEGYTAAEGAVGGGRLMGLLRKGAGVILEVELRAGVPYFVPGGCDADCSDLDLRLLSPDGQTVVAEDVADDDVPILSFTAKETGPHLLLVNMAACRTETCWFGVRVLSR